MPKIVDPSCLCVGVTLNCCVNMKVCTCCSVITLGTGLVLSCCGVTLQAVYSRVKQLWKDTNDPCTPCVAYAAFQFPFISITDEQYELINGWSLGTKGTNNCVTKLLIRDGGWARVDANCVRQEEYMGLATLGTFDTGNGGTFQATCPNDINYVATTATRTSGSWLDDGFTIYNPITITTACCAANNVTFTATVITDLVITAPCPTFTIDCCDCMALFTQLGTGFAYYVQCACIALDCTTDINLAGAVNQAVRISSVIACELVTCAGCGPLAFTHNACAADTIARCAGTWNCMFVFPGFLTVTGAAEACNNKTFLVESVCTVTLTLNDGAVACSGETVVADAVDISSVRFVQETDNRNFFQIYLREEQKNYDFYDLIVCQNLTRGLVNKKFALPLIDSTDNKICCNDDAVDCITCICMVTISYFQTDQPQCISGTSFCYRIVINAACISNANVYQFVQKELRALVDICDRGGCTVDAAEITAVTLPAQSGNIANGDYWILRSAQDQRLYHVWYEIGACNGTEPVIDLSTGILVTLVACDANTVVATKTHAAIVTAVAGLAKNTHLLDFTAAVCAAIVTVTNSFNGRTTDAVSPASAALCCIVFCVSTQGDLASTIGETQTELLNFVGCCLVTSTGVFINNVLCACTNCTTHTDTGGVGRQFAFVSTGVLTFNSNLVCDAGPAQYFMYYTCTATRAVQPVTVTWSIACMTIVDDCGGDFAITPFFLVAGDVLTISNAATGGNDGNKRITTVCMSTITIACVVAANDAADVICIATPDLAFGTTTASLVKDNSSVDISCCVCMACISFNWDFDGNVQGGRLIACPPACSANANVTVVAIGLCAAQYVTTTSTIARTKTNNISIVGALERNFDDPC